MKKDGKCKLFHLFKVNIISGGSFIGGIITALRKCILLLIHLLLHAVLHFVKLCLDLFSRAKNRDEEAREEPIQYVPNEDIAN